MKYRILFLFLLSVTILQAQRDRGSLQLGAVYTGFSAKKEQAPSLYLEFLKTYTGPIAIGFSGSYANPNSFSPIRAGGSLQTFTLSLNGYYQLLSNDFQTWYIGAGFGGRFFDDGWFDDGSGFGVSEFKAGVSLRMLWTFIINDTWGAGLRGSVERYGTDNTVYGIGAFGRYSF